MNGEETDLLIGAIEQICRSDGEPSPPAGEAQFDERLWRLLEQSGFTLVSVPVSLGGSGGTIQQACTVTRAAGRMGLEGPLAETMLLAGWMLAATDISVPSGPLTAAVQDHTEVSLTDEGGSWRLNGVLRRVPWAAAAKLLVCLVHADGESRVVKLWPGAAELRDGHNVAGEPRNDVICRDVRLGADDVVAAGPGVTPTAFAQRAALSRVVGLSGAAEQVLALATAQAKQREQFGRPLAKFQAVQHLLAQLAAETASVVVAGQAASMALEHGTQEEAESAIAAAKASASASAGSIAAWGHQVLGALGFTMEHPLHRSTRRLWAWREEYGNEHSYQLQLASRVISGDAWDLIIGR